MFVENLKV